MSLEKFFWGESADFLLVFWGLFLVLYGVFLVRLLLVQRARECCLAWCFMLVCVAYAYVAALREEKFQKKKATNPLYLLLPAMGFRQRAGFDSCSLNTQAQSIFGGGVKI